MKWAVIEDAEAVKFNSLSSSSHFPLKIKIYNKLLEVNHLIKFIYYKSH